MREIKFRAWDKRKGEWIDNFRIFMHGNIEVYTNYANPQWQPYAKEHFKLIQYTGLKDKNGKEVFEYDIVSGLNHRKDKKLIGKIIYENGRFRIKYGFFKPRNGDRKDLFMTIDLSENNERTDWEIIGNIYENSELLTSP